MRSSSPALLACIVGGGVAAGACIQTTDTTPLGAARVCFARDGDVDAFPLERREDRAGLRVVDDDVAPPEAFATCADGIAETVALVDDAGERVWLGVEANVGARDLVPRGLLATIDDGALTLLQFGGFTPSVSLAVTNGDALVVAVDANRAPAAAAGTPLGVEVAGASAMASFAACGPQSALALRFLGDDGALELVNGDSDGLIVGGREVLATNIHSVDHSGTQCEDSPSGVTTTWIATDGSL